MQDIKMSGVLQNLLNSLLLHIKAEDSGLACDLFQCVRLAGQARPGPWYLMRH